MPACLQWLTSRLIMTYFRNILTLNCRALGNNGEYSIQCLEKFLYSLPSFEKLKFRSVWSCSVFYISKPLSV